MYVYKQMRGFMISYELANEIFDYSPDTGEIRWAKKISKKNKVGAIAGHKRKDGYITIRVNGKLIYGHHIAWIISNGKPPSGVIDHINKNPSDNRIKNLRDVSQRMNMTNRKKQSNNKSGVTGVSFRGDRNKWRAYITNKGKVVNLGYFDDMKDAIHARSAAEELYGYTMD